MRVLLIAHTYIVRINQKKVQELASIPNMHLRVIVPKTWPELTHSTIRVESPIQANFSFCALPTVLAGDGGKYFYRTVDLTMRGFKPDVVHIEESPRGLATFQAALYKRVWSPNARFVFFTWANLERPLPRPLYVFERFNIAQTDHAICGNQDAARLLRTKGFQRPISVIPQLGIDTGVFHPRDGTDLRQRLDLAPQTFVIGFAARMVPEKGLLMLIEAVAHLTGDWTLLLIGKGPDRGLALQRAQALGIGHRVRMVDPVPHLEFAPYLNVMNVLVSPSLTTATWKEQFGLAVAQAMASQVPVVGSLCGETPNLIGNAGLLFREGDVSALSDCLRRLQADPALCTDLGRLGVERIRAHFTFRSIAERTYQVWEGLVNGP